MQPKNIDISIFPNITINSVAFGYSHGDRSLYYLIVMFFRVLFSLVYAGPKPSVYLTYLME